MGEYDYVQVERAKPNVLVAYSREVALQLLEALDLDAEKWACLGVGQRLPGKAWKRIVMMRPHWSLSPAEAIEFEMFVQNWITAKGPDAVFKII